MNTNNRSLRYLLVILFPLLCSFWPFNGEEVITSLRIITSDATNQGAPFYVYVKEVEKGEYLRHEYQQIVNEAFNQSPKIQPFVVFPGNNYEIKIPRSQSEKSLGVYVFYTHPGEEWKMITNGTQRVTLVLGENEILRATIR